MSELEAGPELDALVAEKVMGWIPNARHPNLLGDGWWKMDNGGEEGYSAILPNFSTDIAAAWTVVEKLQDAGMDFSLASRNESRRWWSAVFDIAMTEDRWHSDGYAAPLAICRAALKAVKP